jgi:lysophospholipase L1-like esterase
MAITRWPSRTARLAAAVALVALVAPAGHRPAPPPRDPPMLGRPPVPVFGDFAPPRPGSAPSFYLALGDSLAVGVQPDAAGHSVPSDDGYADLLYRRLASRDGTLRLVKLGCSGENTTTMLGGGICDYGDAGSQVSAAAQFLRANAGRVRLVTVDIGANDINHCAPDGQVDVPCAVDGLSSIGSNLPVLMAMLRAAAPRVPVLAMNYYDPFLAVWLTGGTGPRTAVGTVAVTATVNRQLEEIFHQFGARVVNVQDAFGTTDLLRTVDTRYGRVPAAVARVCAWTWMCVPAPYGPNIHANRAGYQVIADAFYQAV